MTRDISLFKSNRYLQKSFMRIVILNKKYSLAYTCLYIFELNVNVIFHEAKRNQSQILSKNILSQIKSHLLRTGHKYNFYLKHQLAWQILPFSSVVNVVNKYCETPSQLFPKVRQAWSWHQTLLESLCIIITSEAGLWHSSLWQRCNY